MNAFMAWLQRSWLALLIGVIVGRFLLVRFV